MEKLAPNLPKTASFPASKWEWPGVYASFSWFSAGGLGSVPG